MKGTIEVGAFTYEPATGAITGPERYMRERFPAVKAEIEAGRNVCFNAGAGGLSPNVETALLVAVQTDYAGWRGTQQLNAALGGV